MDTKFAILGDIHANLDALEVVLADAKANGATDYICVGDVVGYNAYPNECCELIRALGCVTVCGNHDHYCAFDESLSEFQPNAAAVVTWTREKLTPENRTWLKSLPYTATHRGMTIVHSTLDSPERWGYVFEAIEAEPSFPYQKTLVCFHGHTHVPCIFSDTQGVVSRIEPKSCILKLGHKYFINTGSVGQPRDADPRSSYCLYEPKTRELIYRRLDYDIPAAQAAIRAVGLPDRLATRLAIGR